ncbi:MAG: hypothetical protein KF802_05365 [Bdellovibrionaceae bacterium]|nr:hypothetical protein [Pseudobdellovibrionaceae bacterium]MBX3032338.1 hypothetical protein [Pseudobdellovibrionaceae bacterium]
MKQIFITLMLVLNAGLAQAAPRCLDLTEEQAAKAVKLMKISVYQGAKLLFVSKKESGMVKPLGVWYEKKKGLTGPKSYRVRVDGREVDISLVYVAKSDKDSRAHNLGLMSGCRPAFDKPNMVKNR